MKKEKLTAAAVFLVVLFIVFVFGLFVGKKLSSNNSKEGTIKESALKSGPQASVPQNEAGQTPVSPGNINFTPLSKLSGSTGENVSGQGTNPSGGKKTAVAAAITAKKEKKVHSRIAYVKKPVYRKKYAPKKTQATPHVNFKIYYTIQVAALGEYVQAESLAKKLNSMGFFAYILPAKVSGKNGKAVVYQQVRVGKFSTLAGAKSVENIISKKFKVRPYIIKVG